MTINRQQLNRVEKAIDALQEIDSCDNRDNDFLLDALDQLYEVRTVMLKE